MISFKDFCSLKWIFHLTCCSVAKCIRLFATPWTVAHQVSLSSTISFCLLKFMPIESVMPSNHLIFYCPFCFCIQFFPASGSFPMSWLFASGGQGIGASTSATVLPMNIQGLFSLGLTYSISLQSKGLSRAFSSTTFQKHKFIKSLVLSLFEGPTLTSVHDYRKTHSFNYKLLDL